MLFKSLARLKDLQVDALVMADDRTNIRVAPPAVGAASGLREQALFLDRFLGSPLRYSRFAPLRGLQKLRETMAWALELPYHAQRIDPALFENFLWRDLFEKTLAPKDIPLLQNRSFLFTGLGRRQARLAAYGGWTQPKLITKGYDFVIFQEAQPISVSPGTRRIVRFHDLIPATYPHFFTPWSPTAHIKLLEQAAVDAFIVCNSTFSARQALALMPSLEGRITVVPCALQDGLRPKPRPAAVAGILAARLSDASFSGASQAQKLASRDKLAHMSACPAYIIAVSTLEPRKNYPLLVRAWEQFRARTGQDLKLVIVGSSGWMQGESIEAIRPHVLQGHIFHVEKVPVEDLRMLYACAQVYVSASYAEGFGFGALEAMQCGCPAIVSDGGAHREIMGDAALYFDPNSSAGLVKHLDFLLAASTGGDAREDLRRKGRERVKLYTPARTGRAWMNVLDRISQNQALSLNAQAA